jgi:hypothetical protein
MEVTQLAYDDFRKRLSYTGVLEQTVRDAIKSAAGAGAARFNAAVDTLFDRIRRHPVLRSLSGAATIYAAYIGSTDPVTSRRGAARRDPARAGEAAQEGAGAPGRERCGASESRLCPCDAGFSSNAALHAAGHRSAGGERLPARNARALGAILRGDTATGIVIPRGHRRQPRLQRRR